MIRIATGAYKFKKSVLPEIKNKNVMLEYINEKIVLPEYIKKISKMNMIPENKNLEKSNNFLKNNIQS